MKIVLTHCLRCGLSCAMLLLCLPASPAWARVRLENICSIQGQQETKLTALGLVIGLPGTGDGAKNQVTAQALAQALTKLNHPTLIANLKNADNVAVVMIEASIPKSGIRRGQKVDAFVSSVLGAKSLRGGRLLTTPLTTLDDKKSAIALAGGAITIEDIKLSTTGRLVLGVELLRDVTAQFVKSEKEQVFTLLIDPVKASFITSSEIARRINEDFTYQAEGRTVARSVGPGAVEVLILDTYRDKPVEFIAEVLEVGIETPHSQARVTLNMNSETVVVTGEVEISPVVISHKSFSIEVGAAEAEGPGPFIALSEGQSRQNPVQLQQLQASLNKLRVPAKDIIAIIRELHSTGKLHAELIER